MLSNALVFADQTPALRAVGNIVTGDDAQTQHMLAAGVLRPMASLLQHSKRGLRKEACWAISNITAGSADQIDAVVRADLVPLLVHLLKTAEFDVKKEACWALSNATSGGRGDHVRYLCAQGAVPALCDILATRDAAIIKVALEAIENVLKHGKREAERARHSNVANVVRMQVFRLSHS